VVEDRADLVPRVADARQVGERVEPDLVLDLPASSSVFARVLAAATVRDR
jgi:hypothetical protein